MPMVRRSLVGTPSTSQAVGLLYSNLDAIVSVASYLTRFLYSRYSFVVGHTSTRVYIDS